MGWKTYTALAVFLLWQGMAWYQLAVPGDLCRGDVCVTPVLDFGRDRFDLCLFVGRREKDCEKLVLEKPGLDFREPLEETIQIPMFSETRAENGTLYLTAVFNTDLNGCKKLRSNLYSSSVSLIHYKPQSRLESRFLIGGEDTPQAPPTFSDEYVAHWKHWVKLRVVLDQNHYEARRPAKYSPTIYFDELHLAKRSLAPLSRNASREDPELRFRYLPIGLPVFRLFHTLEQSFTSMRQLGFSDDDVDEILQLMSPDRMYVLLGTYIVSFLHALFAGLAFKNEVAFWRGAKDLYGMSKRSVIGNAVCSVILFLFLLDSTGTSWIVIGTSGVGAVIDLWKTTKILHFSGRDFSKAEKETEKIDQMGMKYLWFVLWPCIGLWALYSLFNHRHRSWYSFVISSLANAVYGFGFLMMWPQIFVNYRLKSVAHLPWRALSYKVFSTFVDDAFAWLISAPLIHKLATLRDDVVFFVFLYQLWIYPVDKSRPNEFGYVAEDDSDKASSKEKTE